MRTYLLSALWSPEQRCIRAAALEAELDLRGTELAMFVGRLVRNQSDFLPIESARLSVGLPCFYVVLDNVTGFAGGSSTERAARQCSQATGRDRRCLSPLRTITRQVSSLLLLLLSSSSSTFPSSLRSSSSSSSSSSFSSNFFFYIFSFYFSSSPFSSFCLLVFLLLLYHNHHQSRYFHYSRYLHRALL